MTLIQSFLVILAIIVLGVVCNRIKVLNKPQIEGLEIFLIKIGMPCYLFTSTLNHDLSALLYTEYIASYLLAFLVIAGLVTVIFFKHTSRGSLCLKILATGYPNSVIYALPIITFLLKDPTAGILVNLLQLVLIQTIFVTMLSFIYHKEKSLTHKIINVITTPIILMPALGMVLNYLQYMPNPVIGQAIQSVGNGAASLALFTFGLVIGGVALSIKTLDRKLLVIVGIKNIVHPIIAFCIGNYIFHLEKYWLYSLVIACSAPTAFVIYLMAKQYHIDEDLAQRVVAVSSITSIFSLVIIIMCFGGIT